MKTGLKIPFCIMAFSKILSPAREPKRQFLLKNNENSKDIMKRRLIALKYKNIYDSFAINATTGRD